MQQYDSPSIIKLSSSVPAYARFSLARINAKDPITSFRLKNMSIALVSARHCGFARVDEESVPCHCGSDLFLISVHRSIAFLRKEIREMCRRGGPGDLSKLGRPMEKILFVVRQGFPSGAHERRSDANRKSIETDRLGAEKLRSIFVLCDETKSFHEITIGWTAVKTRPPSFSIDGNCFTSGSVKPIQKTHRAASRRPFITIHRF